MCRRSVWTGDPPPLAEEGWVPIFRARSQAGVKVVLTTTQLYGVYVHFVQGRTIGCYVPVCPFCKAGYARRWYAYSGAWDLIQRRHGVLEVPSSAGILLSAKLGDRVSCRGAGLHVYRLQPRPQSPCGVKLLELASAETALPPPINLANFLARLWGQTAATVEITTQATARPRGDE